MAFKMKGFSPFAQTKKKEENNEEKVQYAGGEVENTKKYKQAVKDGVETEAEFAEYKRIGREAWLKKYKE